MQTRSKTNYHENNFVNIDFDEASLLWRENKKSMGNGTYIYTFTCKNICKNGKTCTKKCTADTEYCYIHAIK